MKRVMVFLFCVFLIVSISFVSAGFFSDLWNKITGKSVTNTETGDGKITDATASSNTKPLCSDSDGGYNIFVRGTCRDFVGGTAISTNIDSCTNGSLREFYCLTNGSRCLNAFGSCPFGYVCENGACTNQSKNVANAQTNTSRQLVCSDSDGGYNIFIRGTCRDYMQQGITSTNIDACENNVLREFYCANNSICVNAFGSCPFGYICENGTCIDATPPTIEFFNLTFNNSLNVSFLRLYAGAHDYESVIVTESYEGIDPSGGVHTQTMQCLENTCRIGALINNPEVGLWNFTISFTNMANLTISQTQSIYIPPRGFFGRIGEFFREYFNILPQLI